MNPNSKFHWNVKKVKSNNHFIIILLSYYTDEQLIRCCGVIGTKKEISGLHLLYMLYTL